MVTDSPAAAGHGGLKHMKAHIEMHDLPDDTVEVTVEYEDGFTVRMRVGRDSVVLQRLLGDGPQPVAVVLPPVLRW